MKINLFPTIIAVAFCALIAFGMYTWCKTDEMQLLLVIFSSVGLFLTLGTTMGVNCTRPRTTVNVKIVSGIFAGLILLTNIIFCCFSSFSQPFYIILNSMELLLWILIVYGLVQTHKE